MKTISTLCMTFLYLGFIAAQNIGDTFSYTHASHTINYEITSFAPNQVKIIENINITGALEIPAQVSYMSNNYAVVKIGESAFYGDNNLINSITSLNFPEGLLSIERSAFKGNSIDAIQFPSTIMEIADNSFSDNQLTTVSIPALVTYLGDEAFSNNPINSVTSTSIAPAILQDSTFDSRSTISLTIPHSKTTEYITAQWTGFLSITEDISINPYNGVAINTDTSGAALHVKGFTDLSGQPNLKLTNQSGTELLTIYDDGTTSGMVSNQWTELPDGGLAGQVLQTDGNGNYFWADTTEAITTQLALITEGENTGWRLLGREPLNHGDIGKEAIDFSFSNSNSSHRGATGNYSIAIGVNTTASGNTSTAMGEETTASRPAATAMGSSTTASGNTSTAMGEETTASGSSSTAMGSSTIASGNTSTAMGSSTTASGNSSTAMGSNTTAIGNYSTAMGLSTTARSFTETAIGSYNTDYLSSSLTTINHNDRAFVVGIGSSSTAKNDGLIVYKNGTLELDLLNSAPSITSNRIYVLNNQLHYNGEGLSPSQLSKITEASKTGWRLLGYNSDVYGNIGSKAVDLSFSNNSSSTNGATGSSSIAMGLNTTASGSNATAMGNGTLASRSNATAMGNETSASGSNATAMGNGTLASASNATAMGNGTLASASNATAMGKNTTASALEATAMGNETSASGSAATAMGNETSASGSAATAMGNETSASGSNATAMGNGTSASGSAATAMGNGTSASRSNATAMGRNTTASALEATAMGNETSASGSAATAMGEHTTASGVASTAMGEYTIASGVASTAMGEYTIAKSYTETVTGSFNTDYTPSSTSSFNSNDRAFVVGIGSHLSGRHDGLTLLKNGKLGIGYNNFENNNSSAILQVNGSIRLTNNNSSCNANNIGSIRYLETSSGNGQFSGCCKVTNSSGSVEYFWKALND